MAWRRRKHIDSPKVVKDLRVLDAVLTELTGKKITAKNHARVLTRHFRKELRYHSRFALWNVLFAPFPKAATKSQKLKIRNKYGILSALGAFFGPEVRRFSFGTHIVQGLYHGGLIRHVFCFSKKIAQRYKDVFSSNINDLAYSRNRHANLLVELFAGIHEQVHMILRKRRWFGIPKQKWFGQHKDSYATHKEEIIADLATALYLKNRLGGNRKISEQHDVNEYIEAFLSLRSAHGNSDPDHNTTYFVLEGMKAYAKAVGTGLIRKNQLTLVRAVRFAASFVKAHEEAIHDLHDVLRGTSLPGHDRPGIEADMAKAKAQLVNVQEQALAEGAKEGHLALALFLRPQRAKRYVLEEGGRRMIARRLPKHDDRSVGPAKLALA